jgi:type II secretion system protein H
VPNRPRHRAFTLLELILVLVIISIALAMAAPSLRGWSRGGKLRDAGEQFLATARYARTQSAAEARIYRLNVDPQAGTYWLTADQDGQQVLLGNEFGRVFALPQGFGIAMTEGPRPLSYVEFYPTGRTQPAAVRLTADDGFTFDLECPSPAEGFAIVKPTATAGGMR